MRSSVRPNVGDSAPQSKLTDSRMGEKAALAVLIGAELTSLPLAIVGYLEGAVAVLVGIAPSLVRQIRRVLNAKPGGADVDPDDGD